MPDAILELASDDSKIRHRDRSPNNTPIFTVLIPIDSLPSQTTASLSRTQYTNLHTHLINSAHI